MIWINGKDEESCQVLEITRSTLETNVNFLANLENNNHIAIRNGYPIPKTQVDFSASHVKSGIFVFLVMAIYSFALELVISLG